MDGVRQYLLSVISCAVLCGIINSMVNTKSSYGAVLKLLSGLFLAFTVISPLIELKFADYSEYISSISRDADISTEYGVSYAKEEMSSIIKEQAEAYILDKAASMGLNISVEVTLDSSNPPMPAAVSLCGAVSPFSREQLVRYIADNLGIPEECQLWT